MHPQKIKTNKDQTLVKSNSAANIKAMVNSNKENDQSANNQNKKPLNK